jgi:hypothetical protein
VLDTGKVEREGRVPGSPAAASGAVGDLCEDSTRATRRGQGEGTQVRSVTRVENIVWELRPTLALAGPVVLAELGWMAMGVVDTMIAQAFGADDLDGARRSLAQGVILAVVLTPPLMLVVR